MISTGSQVALRKATPADTDQIAEIWRSGWQDGHRGFVPPELVKARTEESFRTRASDRVDDTTVAIVDGEVAGFAMVVDDEVEQVYVSARHRGSGVAAIVMNEAERQVRANGYQVAWLAVVAGNARARAFYQKAGWQDEGRSSTPPPRRRGRSSCRPIVTPRPSEGQAQDPTASTPRETVTGDRHEPPNPCEVQPFHRDGSIPRLNS